MRDDEPESLAENKLFFKSFRVHRTECKRWCRTIYLKESENTCTPLIFLCLSSASIQRIREDQINFLYLIKLFVVLLCLRNPVLDFSYRSSSPQKGGTVAKGIQRLDGWESTSLMLQTTLDTFLDNGREDKKPRQGALEKYNQTLLFHVLIV